MTTNTARAAAGDARSISQSIAEHVVAFDYSQLPASAVQAASDSPSSRCQIRRRKATGQRIPGPGSLPPAT